MCLTKTKTERSETLEVKDKVSKEELKEVAEMISGLSKEDVKVAKGYLSALVDMQELKDKAAG